MKYLKQFSGMQLSAWMVLLFMVSVFVLSVRGGHTATAAASTNINFQARLMAGTGAIVPDGDYNVEFKLYNVSSSSGSSQGSCTGDSACLWAETRTGGNKVRVANGYLTVELGAVTALPSIDWSQNLYLTMNIGGTGTASWDGEMTPRLHLTAVPYAFTAKELRTTNGSFSSSLGFVQPTANRTIQAPDESGTICLQNSTACGFALSTGSGNYIQNQNSSDQTANFRINGTGRAATSFQAPLFDTAAAGTLSIGTSNATDINLDKDTTLTSGTLNFSNTNANGGNTIKTTTGNLSIRANGTNLLTLNTSGAGTVNIGTDNTTTVNVGGGSDVARTINLGNPASGTAAQTVTLGSQHGTSTTTVQGGSGTSAIALAPASGGNINLTTGGTGTINLTTGSAGVIIKPTTNNSAAFQIQNAAGTSIFGVNTSTGLITQNYALRLTGGATNVDTFTTPQGSSVSTAINIPLYNPGASGQLLAFGLPSSADVTSRAISVFDNRTSGVIQPAIALFSPNENDVFGLSWNGLNTVASLETGSAAIALRPGGTNVKLWAGSSGVAIGSNVSSASYPLDVTGDVNTSTQYRIGGTVICTSGGCTPTAGSGNYIQNGTSVQSSANFNISGTGIAGTALQAPLLDTATAAALNIGTTNATSINLNKSTSITGGITQSGGAISLTGNAASSITTSTGALTLTAAGTSSWTVGGTNQSLTITTSGTGVLTLGTTGAGTVTIGSSSSVINIGATNNARTVHIADGGTSTTQAVIVGSTNGASSTTIQGGTGSTAINLNTGTNGQLNISAQGTGGINALIGSAGLTVKTTTNSSYALAVKDSSDLYMFSVSSSTGMVTLGALQATYSGFDELLNTPFGNLTIGSTSNALTIKGSSSMTLQATSGSFTTTVGFTTPTANRTINLPNESGTVCLQAATTCGFAAATGSANYIQNTTTLQNANMAVQAASSGSITAVLQANAAGTADILSLRNGAGTAVATFGYNGAILFKNSTNSAAAFQVQNAAGTNVLLVDTTNQRVAIGNTAPALKFEVQDGDAAVYNNGNNARLVLGDNATTGQYGWLQWDSANDYFRIETAGSNGLKIKDNFVSIGNIFPSKPLIVGNGTNPLLEVGTTGQLQSRTSTNSTTAFQIQNNGSVAYFNADSTNQRIGIGSGMVAPEVTLDVAGAIQQTGIQTSDTGGTDNNKWTKLGSCTITAQYNQCLTTLEILGGHDGSTGNNTQATVSVRVKQQNAMGGAPYVNVNLNDTAEVITKSDIVAVTTVNTGTTTTVELYGRITNTFEHWFFTPVLNTGNGTASTWDWSPTNGFVAALPAGTQNVARYGSSNANLFAVESTNATAVKIQNAGAANTLFVADTVNLRVAIGQATAAYTLDVLGDINTSTQLRIGGTVMCDATGCTAKTGSGFYIHNQTTVQASNFWVQAATTGTVAGTLQAFNGGTGAILQLKNGTGTNVAVFGSAGAVSLQNSTNSTAAFQVTAQGGNSILRVDSTNERVAIGVISDPIGAKLSVATASTVAARIYQSGAFDAFQVANATNDVFNVSQTGQVTTRTTTNSSTGFVVQNSAGNQVFGINTFDNIAMLGTGFGAKHIAMDIETNPYIEVVNAAGSGVSLTQVEAGNAYLTHDTDLIVQRTTASATAFVVDDSNDVNQLTVDTTAATPSIDIGTSDTIGTILVLDTKTGSGDPTGTNGAMYYNSNAGKFRCYEAGTWRDCISGFNTITKASDQAATQSSTTFQNDTALVFAMAANTNYVIDAWIPIDDSNATAFGKYTFTTPSGAVLNLATSSYGTSATTQTLCNIIASGQTCVLSTTASAVNFIQVRGFIRNGANAGNLQFQFAQNVATAASFPVSKKGATLSWHN